MVNFYFDDLISVVRIEFFIIINSFYIFIFLKELKKNEKQHIRLFEERLRL